MLILVLLGMYFDAVVVFVTSQTLIQIGSGHTVKFPAIWQNTYIKNHEDLWRISANVNNFSQLIP